ncbi:MAG: hypothetical protein MUF25_21365 [Pirellulaceae bacterium]|nr:hypothetical protein [Pirellulaceae bacterium]
MSLLALLRQVQQQATEGLSQAADLSAEVCFHFDPALEDPDPGGLPPSHGSCGRVQKTTRRTVVSLSHGPFRACQTVRQPVGPGSQRSRPLDTIVPTHGRYGFDLIAHVGVETYLHGRSLQELHAELAHRQPAIRIPFSTLWDQQQKFLFYLGRLHRRATSCLREYLAQHRPVTWLVDGTTEPGTDVFLGIVEARHGLFLGTWKIASENVDDLLPCFRQAADWYGLPDEVLHDLSSAMSAACEQALPGIPHYVCHQHLARDVGEDLYAAPQAALCKRTRTLQLQYRLKEQRQGQNEWLRQRIDSAADFVLAELLAGRPVQVSSEDTFSREILLAFHFWILDYRSDGRRRGFPFDPYLLYLHRRLVRAGEAIDRLLSQAAVACRMPQVIRNFQALLQAYRNDPQIHAAADLYERCWGMFARLREALRLSAEHMDQLRQPQELPADQQRPLQRALEQLRRELQQQSRDDSDPDQPLAQIVLTHLDKYWEHLLPDRPLAPGEHWQRTTNELESDWGTLKRCRRRTHGRGKLTRDFQSLPKEYPLVRNLENETYLQLVLGGSLDSLPAKLAEASREAGTFDAWRRQRRPRLLGELPRRLLREDDFVDRLVDTCFVCCQSPAQHAA